MKRHLLIAIMLAAALALAAVAAAADPLPSWNDGTAKQSIVNFVQRVTTVDGPDFVPVSERIAVLDNDGTLWAEKPMYVQLAFTLAQVKALAPLHPEWKDKQPFKAALEGDLKTVAAGGEHALLEMVMATHAGMTTDAFDQALDESNRQGWTVVDMKQDWKQMFPDEKQATVSGTVFYLQRIALPPEASVEVKLVDISRQDVPAVTIAEHQITNPGQVPIPFELRYDPAKIDPRMSYAVQARIELDGKPWFISTRVFPVITRGNPKQVEVRVDPVK